MFLKWWSFTILTAFILGAAHYFFGVMNYIYETDATKLTFVIMGLYVWSSIQVGKFAWGLSKHRYFYKHQTQKLWYSAEACMGLGMIGTLFGFLVVLSTAFTEIDVNSTESMKETISALASGMGTALLTSLVGLISSILLKYQLVAIETENETI